MGWIRAARSRVHAGSGIAPQSATRANRLRSFALAFPTMRRFLILSILIVSAAPPLAVDLVGRPSIQEPVTPKPARAEAGSQPKSIPDIDAWVARAMATFQVPGIALAVVKDDRVVVAKGYGVRKLGEPAKVDEKTLFGIASKTKAFRATALGRLVE